MWIFTPLDTFHFPFVHASASPPVNGVCGSGCTFLSKIGDMSHIWIAIWKLAATLLCPNLQVTQRIYSAMQISREEIWGSVQQVCLKAEYKAKNISFQCFKCSFVYQIGHTEVACGCANCHHGNYIKAALAYSSLLWRQIGPKRARTEIHNNFTS